MKKLTLLQETKNNTIDINGHVFEILLSDDEVYTLPVEYQKKFADVDVGNAEQLAELIEYVNGLYTRVLGADSLRIISGGKPIPLTTKIEWFGKIFNAISDSYFEALIAKYE